MKIETPKTREETNLFYKQVIERAAEKNKAQEIIAELGRKDLFFLLTNIMGRKDCDRDWIFERAREVQANPNGYLDLWAREHYKSTLITLGMTTLDLINDPELTFGIISFTRPIAKAFLRQLKHEYEFNERLKILYPHVFWKEPKKEAPKWSEDEGIVLKRKGNPKEATIEAWGLTDGQPTSKHFKVCIYNDIVTRDNVTSLEMIQKTNIAWEQSLSLGSIGGVRRYEGTFWAHNDTYHLIIERGAAIPRIYPATEDGTEEGKPVFMSPEELRQKRKEMGPYTFSCQMLLNPIASEYSVFKREWLKFWSYANFTGHNKYILIDPAGEKKKNSDYTAIIVLGLGADENYYVITMVMDKLSLTERANLLFSLHRQYRPIQRVYYEKSAMNSDIEYIKEKMNRENYRFHIEPVRSSVKKEDRIKSLVPYFQEGRIYLPKSCPRINYEGKMVDVVEEFIEGQYIPFPLRVHDDLIDCLAMITLPNLYFAFPSAYDIKPEIEERKDERQLELYDPLERR